jgi:hypothetical protein
MALLRGMYRLFTATCLIAIGVLVYAFSMEELVAKGTVYFDQMLDTAPPIPFGEFAYRHAIGAFLALYGFIKFWMALVPNSRPRTVTFSGTHGDVTIELEPVESTLQRVAMKLPEVKNISLQLKPLDGDGRILVDAVAILAKNADDDARMITARIHNFLKIHTRKIVGLQHVEAKLTVKRWHMKMKTVKVEPLLLEAKEDENVSSPRSEKRVHKFERSKVIETPQDSTALEFDSNQDRKFGKL